MLIWCGQVSEHLRRPGDWLFRGKKIFLYDPYSSVRYSQGLEICGYCTTKGLGPSTASFPGLGISRWGKYSSYLVFYIEQVLLWARVLIYSALRLHQEKLPSSSPCIPQLTDDVHSTKPCSGPKLVTAKTNGDQRQRMRSFSPSVRCQSVKQGSALLTALAMPQWPDHTTSPRCVVHDHEGSCCACFIYCKSCLIALNNHTSVLRDEIACLGIFLRCRFLSKFLRCRLGRDFVLSFQCTFSSFGI